MKRPSIYLALCVLILSLEGQSQDGSPQNIAALPIPTPTVTAPDWGDDCSSTGETTMNPEPKPDQSVAI